MRKEYASRLTKEMLIKAGITNITENGIIYKNDKPIRTSFTKGQKEYKKFPIYELDENGNKIKENIDRYGKGYYSYKITMVCVHRAMWAWYHNEIPTGYVIDHIDNDCTNNTLSNLQMITQEENLAKDRKPATYIPPMRRKMYSLEEIDDKIAYHKARLEIAKKAHNAEEAHKIRASVSIWKRRKLLIYGHN